MNSNDFYHISNLSQGEESHSRIHSLQSENGTGEMVCYEVSPGIQISYNDLKMDSCYQPIVPSKDFLQIDHCLEGCYEFELESGSVSFLGEGDLCVTNLCRNKQIFANSRIPLKRYRGITILLELETAQKTLNKNFKQAHINLAQIKDTLCASERSLLIRTKKQIDHIFSELYRVDERIQMPYFWIKIVEILLYLSLLDNSSMQRPQQFSEEISKKNTARISIFN